LNKESFVDAEFNYRAPENDFKASIGRHQKDFLSVEAVQKIYSPFKAAMVGTSRLLTMPCGAAALEKMVLCGAM
jgi:hypothetical protein